MVHNHHGSQLPRWVHQAFVHGTAAPTGHPVAPSLHHIAVLADLKADFARLSSAIAGLQSQLHSLVYIHATEPPSSPSHARHVHFSDEVAEVKTTGTPISQVQEPMTQSAKSQVEVQQVVTHADDDVAQVTVSGSGFQEGSRFADPPGPGLFRTCASFSPVEVPLQRQAFVESNSDSISACVSSSTVASARDKSIVSSASMDSVRPSASHAGYVAQQPILGYLQQSSSPTEVTANAGVSHPDAPATASMTRHEFVAAQALHDNAANLQSFYLSSDDQADLLQATQAFDSHDACGFISSILNVVYRHLAPQKLLGVLFELKSKTSMEAQVTLLFNVLYKYRIHIMRTFLGYDWSKALLRSLAEGNELW